MLRIIILAAIATLSLAAPSRADEAGVNGAIDRSLGNHALYETAIGSFQQAVAEGSREDVAAFVRYPIVVQVDGRKRTIRSAAAFVVAYDQIMTPDIVAAVKSQKYGDLFVNSEGVMFGDGQVWIDGICLDRGCRHFVPKVITIQHTGQ
jgi:hypothetical protein